MRPQLKAFVILVSIGLILPSHVTCAVATEHVDTLLVLAADASYSIDDEKFKLQRTGYAKAITDPRVLDVATSGANGRIAVCFVEWSGEAFQQVVVDWSVIDDVHTARAFAERIILAPRAYAERTSISAAVRFSIEQLQRAPFLSHRRVIDISGDGINNAGRDVRSARDEALIEEITINGLAILTERSPVPEHTNPPDGLVEYYRENVVGGPGAFVMAADGFEAFTAVLIKKLVQELAAVKHSETGVH
jgi:hypothetical protein